ncbi:Hypothetical protein SMAX5B_017404 [Scophthalmus maximus]|uniref:Uncharacterized protein n=1 Tax=Scophthalmus maximus TaxID=52904 RepID=A0A2U9CMJ6_SCOMX|nr:Hypothetical protein SMAX5B_017404 [Scophthalmus maximus]
MGLSVVLLLLLCWHVSTSGNFVCNRINQTSSTHVVLNLKESDVELVSGRHTGPTFLSVPCKPFESLIIHRNCHGNSSDDPKSDAAHYKNRRSSAIDEKHLTYNTHYKYIVMHGWMHAFLQHQNRYVTHRLL